MQLQHLGGASTPISMELLEANAEVHGVVCMSDYTSIAIANNWKLVDPALRKEMSRGLRPSAEFEASLT